MMMNTRMMRAFLVTASLAAWQIAGAAAEEETQARPPAAERFAAESGPPAKPFSDGPATDLAIDYCRSFGQPAVDARHARQKKELTELKETLEGKLAEVREQADRLQVLLEKHDAIMAVAAKDFVKIYEATEPAAAAQQLEKVEPWVSATILRRLKPKLAGEILSVMATEKAARLVSIMTSQTMNERKPEGSKSVAN